MELSIITIGLKPDWIEIDRRLQDKPYFVSRLDDHSTDAHPYVDAMKHWESAHDNNIRKLLFGDYLKRNPIKIFWCK